MEVFKYLERMIAYDDEDTQEVRVNLKKARCVWARISRILRAENETPCEWGMFYNASFQSVLLFASNACCLAPLHLKVLKPSISR